MYRIEESDEAIKEVQRLLGILQSGRYDNSTRVAVSDVQRASSLPITGITDYKTFTRIVRKYKDKTEGIFNSDFLFSPHFPYIKGDMGGDVGRINDALAIVLKSYSYEGVSPRGKYIGEDTMNGVKFLERIFGMDERDEIDARLMNRILIELDGIKIKEKFGIK